MKTRMTAAREVFDLARPKHIEMWRRSRPMWVEDIEARFSALSAMQKDWDRAFEGAHADEDLSAAGRSKRLATTAQAFLVRLSAFEADTVAKCRARVQSIGATTLQRTAPKPPTEPGERLAWELSLHEIRAELRGLDPLQRAFIYATSADPLVWAAVETAPPSVVQTPGSPGAMPALRPFVDLERIGAAQQARIEAANPEAAEDLEDLRILADQYESYINRTREALFEDVPEARGEAITVQG